MPSLFPRAVAKCVNVLGAEPVTQRLVQPVYYWNNFDVLLVYARNLGVEEMKDFSTCLKDIFWFGKNR